MARKKASWLVRLLGETSGQLLLISIVTFVAYSNILQNGFAYDDSDFIVDWQLIRDPQNLPQILSGAVPPGHEGVYRPLRGVFYVLDYWLWGPSAKWYHLQSILIHLACTILVYLIALEIGGNKAVAFMTSLVFGVHPIHTESISFTTTSLDIIGVVFFFTSFYLYLKALRVKNASAYHAGSAIFALAAFFTYELTLTLPFMMLLHHVSFRRNKHRDGIAKFAPYFASLSAYLFIRFVILGITGRGAYFAGSFYHTMLTMAKAFALYVLLTAVPLGLAVEHIIPDGISSHVGANMNSNVILAQTIFDPKIMASLAFLAFLAAIAINALKKNPVISFCIAWFFIGLSPVSGIIPQQVIMCEKYLYISSFGFCLLFSHGIRCGIDRFRKNHKPHIRSLLIGFFILTVFALSSLTYSRNPVWADNLALWSKTAEDSHESAYPLINLGHAYLKAGKTGQAAKETQKAIMLNPFIAEAHNNLGEAYLREGRYDIASSAFEKAIGLNPNLVRLHGNLGNAYARQGRFSDAAEELQTAIRMNPNIAEIHNDLGNVYGVQGNLGLAVSEYNRAIELNPNMAEARSNLGNAYARQGDVDKALVEIKKAIGLNPNLPQAHNDLGSLYRQMGRKEQAIEEYHRAIEIDPNFTIARKNLENLEKA
ncbi:MAG: tetratricopeptide repeat protein [Candidatus Altiarchaeota archaeon]